MSDELVATELSDAELLFAARLELHGIGILPDSMLDRPIHRHMTAEGIRR
jgi:hypothetical protein